MEETIAAVLEAGAAVVHDCLGPGEGHISQGILSPLYAMVTKDASGGWVVPPFMGKARFT